MALVNKLVNSSSNENRINRRLAEMSYSAIGGERQEPKSYAPEGVIMPGQIDREKPLEAITKEMIKDYQASKIGPAEVIGGVPYQYKQTGFGEIRAPIDYSKIKDDTLKLSKKRQELALLISETEADLKDQEELRLNLIFELNTKGQTPELIQALRDNDQSITFLYSQLDAAKTETDKTIESIRSKVKLIEDIKKSNAISDVDRKQKVKEFETIFNELNRDRTNIQQQPYENDYDYYKRLKEIEKQQYDPLLYKQISLNQNIEELKGKLPSLFKEVSVIEDIIKSLPDEYKFLVNKYFDVIEKQVLSNYGYNNTSIQPKQLATELIDIAKKSYATDLLTGAFKRTKTREGYSDYLDYSRAGDKIVGAWKAKKARREVEKTRKERIEKQGKAEAYKQFQEIMQDRDLGYNYDYGYDPETEIYDPEAQVEEGTFGQYYDRPITPLPQYRELPDGSVIIIPPEAQTRQGPIVPIPQWYLDDQFRVFPEPTVEEIRARNAKPFQSMLEKVPDINIGKRKDISPLEQEILKEKGTRLQRVFRGHLGRKIYKKEEEILQAKLDRIKNDPIRMPNLPWGQTVVDENTGETITYPTYEEARKKAEIEYLKKLRLAIAINRPVRKYIAKKAERERQKAEEEYAEKAAARKAQIEKMTPGSSLIIGPIKKPSRTPTPEKIQREKVKEQYEKAKEEHEIQTNLSASKLIEEQIAASQRNLAARNIQQAYRKKQKVNIVLNTIKDAIARRDAIVKNTISDIVNGLVTEVEKNAAANEVKALNQRIEDLTKFISEEPTIPSSSPQPSPMGEISPMSDVSPTPVRKSALAFKAITKALAAKRFEKAKKSALNVIAERAVKKQKQLEEEKATIIRNTVSDIVNTIATEDEKRIAAREVAKLDKAARKLQQTARAINISKIKKGAITEADRRIGEKIAAANREKFRQEAAAKQAIEDEKAAIARKEMYDAAYKVAYDTAISSGASAASAASYAAGATANIAASALTGVARSFGFFKTAEEKAREAEEKRIAIAVAKAKAERIQKEQEAAAIAKAEQIQKAQEAAAEAEKLKQRLIEGDKKAEQLLKLTPTPPRPKTPPKTPTPTPPLPVVTLKKPELDKMKLQDVITLEKHLTAYLVATGPANIDPKTQHIPGAIYQPDKTYSSADYRNAYNALDRVKNRITREQMETTKRPSLSGVPPGKTTSTDVNAVDDIIFGPPELLKTSSTNLEGIKKRLETFINVINKDFKGLEGKGNPGVDQAFAKAGTAEVVLELVESELKKARKKGKGFNKMIKARKVKIPPEETMKSRLRLVVSQIQAGNTNPKLIVEVNKLYKKLYKIDNAYSLIKK